MGSDDPRRDVANGGRLEQLFAESGTKPLGLEDQGGNPVDERPRYSAGGTLLEDMNDMESAGNDSEDSDELQSDHDEPDLDEVQAKATGQTKEALIFLLNNRLANDPQDAQAIGNIIGHFDNVPEAFQHLEVPIMVALLKFKPDKTRDPFAYHIPKVLEKLRKEAHPEELRQALIEAGIEGFGENEFSEDDEDEMEQRRAADVTPQPAEEFVSPDRPIAGGFTEGPLSAPITTFGRGSEGDTTVISVADVAAASERGNLVDRVNGLAERAAAQDEKQNQIEADRQRLAAEMQAMHTQQKPPVTKLSKEKIRALKAKWMQFCKTYREGKIAVHLQPYLSEFLQAIFEILTDPSIFRLFRLTEYLHEVTETEWDGMKIAEYDSCVMTLRSDLLRFSFEDGRIDFRLHFLEELEKEGTAFDDIKQKQQLKKLFEAIKAHLAIIRGMHRQPEKLADFCIGNNDSEDELLGQFFDPVFDLFFDAAKAVRDLSKAEDDAELVAFWEEVNQLTLVLPDEVWHGLEVMKVAEDLTVFFKKDLLISVNGEVLRANLDTGEGKDELREVLRPHAADIIDKLPLDAPTFADMVITCNE